MTGNLNLNNNKIINLQTDYKDSKSAVNVDFMQNEITSMRDLLSQSIHESHIISSAQKRDAFRYLMVMVMLRFNIFSFFECWVV